MSSNGNGNGNNARLPRKAASDKNHDFQLKGSSLVLLWTSAAPTAPGQGTGLRMPRVIRANRRALREVVFSERYRAIAGQVKESAFHTLDDITNEFLRSVQVLSFAAYH